MSTDAKSVVDSFAERVAIVALMWAASVDDLVAIEMTIFTHPEVGPDPPRSLVVSAFAGILPEPLVVSKTRIELTRDGIPDGVIIGQWVASRLTDDLMLARGRAAAEQAEERRRAKAAREGGGS